MAAAETSGAVTAQSVTEAPARAPAEAPVEAAPQTRAEARVKDAAGAPAWSTLRSAARSPVEGPGAVPDVVAVGVPAGALVLVVSDLHLEPVPTPASVAAASELVRRLDAWSGPGVVVLAGDCFELLGGEAEDPVAALEAHPGLAAALARFGQAGTAGRRLLCLPGNHDGRLAWDAEAGSRLAERTGADLALAVELAVQTADGPRVVRVEHGHQFDPHNAFADPRNPLDTPLGHHLVRELMPGLKGAPGTSTWLSGFQALADPVTFPRFLASRLAYRRLGRHARWLLLPFLLTLALKVPVVYSLAERTGRADGLEVWGRRLVILGVGALLDMILVGLVAAVAARRTWAALSGVVLSGRGLKQNDAPRERARRLQEAGVTGLVTGHTHHPELSLLGDGFYANTGCGTEVVDECPVRLGTLGLPPVFLGRRELSWVEMEGGAELEVRLLRARKDLPDGTLLERLLARRRMVADDRPAVVGRFPGGPAWPPPAGAGVPTGRRHRPRAGRAPAPLPSGTAGAAAGDALPTSAAGRSQTGGGRTGRERSRRRTPPAGPAPAGDPLAPPVAARD